MDHDSVTVVIDVIERDLPHRTKVIMQALKMDEQGHLKLVHHAIGLMILIHHLEIYRVYPNEF